MRCRVVPGVVLLASLVGLPAWAGPVASDTETDPHELAVSWTLASLSPQAWPGLVPGIAPAVPAASPRHGGATRLGPADAVPDPGAYALMGALLLGAGLAGRHWAARRRPRR